MYLSSLSCILYLLSATLMAVHTSPLPPSVANDDIVTLELGLGILDAGTEKELWALLWQRTKKNNNGVQHGCAYLEDGKLNVSISVANCGRDWSRTDLQASISSQDHRAIYKLRNLKFPAPCVFGGLIPVPGHDHVMLPEETPKGYSLGRYIASKEAPTGGGSADGVKSVLKYFADERMYVGDTQAIPPVFLEKFKNNYLGLYNRQCGLTPEGQEVLHALRSVRN
jgi:hypothetical protein